MRPRFKHHFRFKLLPILILSNVLSALEEWRKRKMERARLRQLEKNGTLPTQAWQKIHPLEFTDNVDSPSVILTNKRNTKLSEYILIFLFILVYNTTVSLDEERRVHLETQINFLINESSKLCFLSLVLVDCFSSLDSSHKLKINSSKSERYDTHVLTLFL